MSTASRRAQVIAEGAPEHVRNDPKVVASYLGTDERAIVRSGATPTPVDPVSPGTGAETPASLTAASPAAPDGRAG